MRRHLRQVYANLTVAALFAAWATQLYARGWLPRADLPVLILGIAALTAIRFFASRSLRQLLLYGFGFTQGWSLGPLVRHYAAINPSSINQAVLASVALFAAFTGSALVVERRAYLYISGVILALSLMGIGLWFMSWWGFGVFLYQIMIGLAISCFYVVFDTQIMIEQFESGTENDPIQHAAALFINLIGILGRMIIILNQDRGERERPRRKSQDRQQRGPL